MNHRIKDYKLIETISGRNVSGRTVPRLWMRRGEGEGGGKVTGETMHGRSRGYMRLHSPHIKPPYSHHQERGCPLNFPFSFLSAWGRARLFLTKYLHVIYRVQSNVCRLPKYWPPPPSPPSECVLPPHQRRGGTHTLAGRWGGQYFWMKTPEAVVRKGFESKRKG
jgi:hypothetical protein